MNFTFFSRPLQRPQAASTAATPGHPVESTVVQAATTTNRLRGTPLFSEQRMAWLQPPKPAPRAATAAAATPHPPPPPPLVPPLLPDTRHGETVAQPRSQPEARVAPDAAAVTTSSVCSGNGDRSQLKRSSHHLAADWSVSPDEEDLDDEPEPGATRRSAARSAKRSRTAEVHNLSERRRRDRINEKMRALQELIPNCNKIDKASMLEEAIEYLKTLQLQVQMMSMGTGLCMPPPAMLLPSAMHQQYMQALPLHHHHMPMAHAHFPHLGMGLGFGMGMGAAAAAGFDVFPRVAAGAHGHFPCPPMAMPPPGAVFGVPGQGMPSMPLPAAFAHMAGAAPAGQMEAGAGAGVAAAAAAPARSAEAEHRPVGGVAVAQGDQEAQHPKQT